MKGWKEIIKSFGGKQLTPEDVAARVAGTLGPGVSFEVVSLEPGTPCFSTFFDPQTGERCGTGLSLPNNPETSEAFVFKRGNEAIGDPVVYTPVKSRRR